MAPVFFMMIFGIIEFGFLFRNYLTISSVTSETARTAAIAGNDADADFRTLQIFRQAFAAWGLEDLNMIVIYEASGPDDSGPPGACLIASSATLNCNHYAAAQLYIPKEDGNTVNFGDCVVGGSLGDSDSLDQGWCPLQRDVTLGATPDPSDFDDAGLDYIGVYVSATHDYLTGFFGSERELTYNQVVRVEPERQ